MVMMSMSWIECTVTAVFNVLFPDSIYKLPARAMLETNK
jgi:hypothetical protein